MSTIDRAAATLYDAINSLPGPGRIARLAAALLVTPFAAAAPSLSRRTTTALVENPSFDTFPHPVPGGDFVHRCDNTKGVLSLGTKGVTVCDLTSSSCHTLSDPSGSTFTGRVVLEHGDAALPCNSLFFGQSYTDAGGSQVRVGKYTGSGFTVQGSSPASSGANQLTTSSIGVNGNRDKFYIGSGFAGTTENGYLVTRLDSDGSNGISWHKEDTHLSSSGRVVEPNVYAISWVNQNGSWLSVVEFALNSETSNSMTARVKSGNFATTQSINVPSSSTALTKLQTQNLPNEQFLSAAIGNGSVDGPMIHLNLLHMPAESKIPTKLDSSDLSLTSVDHISISPPDASGTTKLYWSSGGVVSVADISIVNNALTITGQATLFDLGNVTLDGLSTTTYQNGKQVVAYGLSGQTKVWVGDVIVPATTSPAPAATTAAVSGGVPFSVGGGLQSQAHMCGDVAHFQMGPGGSDQYDVCPVTSGSVLNGCQSVNPVAGSSGSGPVYFADPGEIAVRNNSTSTADVTWPTTYTHSCDGTYWVQKYTNSQGSDRLRIGVTESDGSLTELASDLQVGNSASFNITSAAMYNIPPDSRRFVYVSSTYSDGGSLSYSLSRFLVEGDGSSARRVQEEVYPSQVPGHKENTAVFTAPQIVEDTGFSGSTVVRFGIDQGSVIITRTSKFITLANESPTTFATASGALDSLRVNHLQEDRYIIAAVGDQGTVHVGLAEGVRFWDGSMSVSSVIDVDVSGITALSLAVDPTNRENAYVYWAQAGKVYSMQVRTSEGQVSTSTPVTVFDLGAVNVDQLSTGIYQNGKHAITYEVGGVPKAWVGDVIVPATTAPAPAATSPVPCQNPALFSLGQVSNLVFLSDGNNIAVNYVTSGSDVNHCSLDGQGEIAGCSALSPISGSTNFGSIVTGRQFNDSTTDFGHWVQTYTLNGNATSLRAGSLNAQGLTSIPTVVGFPADSTFDATSVAEAIDSVYVGGKYSESSSSGTMILRLLTGSSIVEKRKFKSVSASNLGATETNLLAITFMVDGDTRTFATVFEVAVDPSNFSQLRVTGINRLLDSSTKVESVVPTSNASISQLKTYRTGGHRVCTSFIGDSNSIECVVMDLNPETKTTQLSSQSTMQTPGVVSYDNNWNASGDELYQVWSDGNGVFLNHGKLGTNGQITLESKGCLFSLSGQGSTVNHVQVGQFTNGKLAVGIGFADGNSKVWVGDVIVPATTAPDPAATTAAVSGPVFKDVGGRLVGDPQGGVVCEGGEMYVQTSVGDGTHNLCLFDGDRVSCNNMAAPVGHTSVSSFAMERLNGTESCNGGFAAQASTATDSSRSLLIYQLDGTSGPPVIRTLPVSYPDFSPATLSRSSFEWLYYVGGGVAVTGKRGYGVQKVDPRGPEVLAEFSEAAAQAEGVEPNLFVANYGDNGFITLVRFSEDLSIPGALCISATNKAFNFEASSSVSSTSSSFSQVATNYLGNDQYLTCALGEDKVHFFLNSVEPRNKVISNDGAAELSAPTAKYMSFTGTYPDLTLAWSDGSKVFTNRIQINGNQTSVGQTQLLFDLGGATVDGITVGQYSNGKHVVALGVDGATKLWVGDIVTPEVSSVPGPVETGVVQTTDGGAEETGAGAAPTTDGGMEKTGGVATTGGGVATDGVGSGGASVDGGGGTTGGGMLMTAAPAVTGVISGGPVVGGAQGSDGGSSVMGIVAGVVAGVVLLVFAAIVIVWRRRGHSEKKSLLNFNNSDIDRRPLGGASETSMEAVVAASAGMMSGGVLGGGPPPAVPPRDDDDLYERIKEPGDPEYVEGMTPAQRLNREHNPDGERGDEGLYRNGGMLDGGGDEYRLSERDWRSAGGSHMSEPPPHQYDPVQRPDLRPRASLPADGGYRQPDDALPPELEEGPMALRDDQYANRDDVNAWERDEMREMEERLRIGRHASETSNPLDVSGSSGNGDTSSSDPESPTAAAPQPPGWMGPTASRASIHV